MSNHDAAEVAAPSTAPDTRAIVSALAELPPEDLALGTYDLYQPGKLISAHSTYLNLGYWPDERTTLPEAGDALADALADVAGLAPGQTVLDVGVGFGDQDLRWAARLDLARLVAIGLTDAHLAFGTRRARERGLDRRVEFRRMSATDIADGFAPATFDRVLALESAFHFRSREDFFRQAHTVLRPGGVLALADIVPISVVPGTDDPLRLTLFSGMQPVENWYGIDEYRDRLACAGFDGIETTSIRERVFVPYLRNLLRTTDDPAFAARVGAEIADVTRAQLHDPGALRAQIDRLDYVLVRARRAR